jgi:hypothetical protein
MHPRILSPLEERQIRSYLRHDGEKIINIRVLVSRARGQLPQIRQDVALLDKLLATYEKKGRGKMRVGQGET